MRPVGGHGIGGSNGTQGNGTFIGTLVAHHAHTLYGQKNDTRLPDLMVERCLVAVGILHFPVAQAPDENIVGFLQGLYFLPCYIPQDADSQSRTGEG